MAKVSKSRKGSKSKTKVTRANFENTYGMQVLSLINIARQIRDGRARDVAKHIEKSTQDYLRQMEDFAESNVKTVAFYAGGKLLKASKQRISARLARTIRKYSAQQGEALSDQCYKLTSCGGGRRCWKWPTSLQPVDPDQPDEYHGWRYVVGSRCGIKIPSGSPCGQPLGMYQCQPPE